MQRPHDSTPKWLAIFALASLGLHIAMLRSSPCARTNARAMPNPITIDFSTDEAAPSTALHAEARTPSETVRQSAPSRGAAVADPARSTQRDGSVAPRAPSAAAAPVSIVTEDAIEDAIDEALGSAPRARRDSSRAAASSGDLSPLAAALTLAPFEQDAATSHAGSATSAAPSPGPSTGRRLPTLPNLNERPHLSRRDPPHLTPHPDGSYFFHGPRFDARIEPDGTVAFLDPPPVAFDGFSLEPLELPSTAASALDPWSLGVASSSMRVPIVPQLHVRVRADITEAILRAIGDDPDGAERRWFLEHTQSLRDELGERARQGDERTSRRALRRAMREIFDDASLSLRDKHARIFAIWDGCEADAAGERAHALIEAEIRERFTSGSALEYTDAELSELNERRKSARAFAPYAPPLSPP